TWEANQQALPRSVVLLAGRGPLAVLGALATVVMFWIGYEVVGMGVGLIAALLLGLDPLSLLHTRRAMAEGSLIFFSALAAWGSLRLARACDAWETFRWRIFAGGALVGTLAGLAMASKQTEVVMLPVALLAIGLPLLQRPWPLAQRWRALAAIWLVIGLGGALTFWALNPILYRQPLNVAQKMLELRAQLAQEQIEVNGAAHPDMLTPTPLARLRAAFWQVYVRPPAFWDAPVYLDHLKPLTETYLSSPVNSLLRRPLFGPVIAVLSAVGVAASGYRLIRGRLSPATRAEQVVWWWSAATLVLLLFAIPLDWQRYFLPLLAPARLFAAIGLAALFRLLALGFPALASFVRRSRLALRRVS
ncbi:MAG: glycosyltransferase family 39 protein, partial [Chloroflexi bacterium]|nr:glycosyltransferase family 39 protein [Chloroflexota bacterium]